MNNLAEFIKDIRIKKGLSHGQIAERSKSEQSIGLSRSYVSMIEAGNVTNLSASAIKSLAKGLGVSEKELAFAALGLEPDHSLIANEKIARIGFRFEKMPVDKQRDLTPLIDLLDREIERITQEEEDKNKD